MPVQLTWGPKLLLVLMFILATDFTALAQCDDTKTISPSTATICAGETVDITVFSSQNNVNYRLFDAADNPISGTVVGDGNDIVITSDPLTASTTIKVEVSRVPCSVYLLQTAAVTVNPAPVADAGSDGTICEGDAIVIGGTPSASGGAGGYTYLWSNPGTLDDPNAANPTATPTGNTTYELTVMDMNGCLSAVSSVTITVNSTPSAPGVTNQEICQDQAVPMLTATGAGTINWYSDAGLTTLVGTGTTYTPTAEVDNTTPGIYSLFVTQTISGCVSPAAQADVTVNESPVADAGLDQVICIGGSVEIGGSPSATGGTGSYTYSWSPATGLSSTSIANPIASPASTTPYTLVVTDSKGCVSASSVVTVTVNSTPPAPSASDEEICLNGTIPTLNASGSGGTYNWYADPALSTLLGTGASFTPAPADLDVTIPGTTRFYLTESLATCTSVIVPVDITVHDLPVANAGPDLTICEGESITIGGSPSAIGGSGVYGYAWTSLEPLNDNTLANPVASPTTTATYTLIVTDNNGCASVADAMTITVNAKPAAPAAADPAPICVGQGNPSLTASGSSIRWYSDIALSNQVGVGSPFTPSTAVVDNSVAGTTTLYATQTVAGCESDATPVDVLVNPALTVTATSADTDICAGSGTTLGGIVTGGDGNYTYSWSPAASLSDPNILAPTATPSTSTTYTLTVTDDDGCSKSSSVTVTVNSLPIANAGPDQSVCAGSSVTIGGSPSAAGGNGVYLYSWTGAGLSDNSIANPVATPTTTTTYFLTITDGNNCVSATDAVTITVLAVPGAPVAADPAPICAGEANPVLTATGTNIKWYSDAGLTNQVGAGASYTPSPSVVDNSIAGTTQVYVTQTSSGCESPATTVNVVVNEQPVANAGTDLEDDDCDSAITLAAIPSAGTGMWTGPAQISFDDATSPTAVATASAAGEYELTWTETSGSCTDEAKIMVSYYATPTPDAGTGGDTCGLNFLLGATPSVGTGTWTQSAGPGTATFNNANSPNATVTVDAYGTYDFTWTETNGTCSNGATISVTFDEQPVANAGTDLEDDDCDSAITLAAIPTAGTGMWTGPAQISFDDATSPTAVATASAAGEYELTWTETSGSCSDEAKIMVSYYENPTPDAGTGGDTCGLRFLLGATPSVGTGTWTQSAGPGTATFNNANSPNATVTVDAYGTYDFTWTETNGTCSNGATISVTFDEQPVANAGTDLEDDDCDSAITLAAIPSAGTGLWTGPAQVSFDDATSPTAVATASAAGEYELTWTETSGSCTDEAKITVTYYQTPVANAGSGGDTCGLNFLLGATPSVGTGTWTQSAGPGTASFNNANSPNATVTVDAFGTYDFTWTETNGTCSNGATISVSFYEQPVANAGTDLEDADCDSAITLAAIPSAGTGMWTGPAQISFDDATSPTAVATASAPGDYDITWTEETGLGTCSSSATITVSYYETPTPDAGSGGDTCGLSFLLGATPSVGTGTWTLTSGPGTASFNNANSPNATVTVDVFGTYNFTWTETNGTCSNGATISVSFYEQPVANAGTDLEDADCDSAITLAAIPSAGTGMWTGPAQISFDDATSPTAVATASASGEYELTWTETSGSCTDEAKITVTYYQTPVANAGSGGDTCGLNFLLGATPSVGTGTWTQSAGSGTASFNNANSPNATVTVDAYGTYEFTWTETNGTCSNGASVMVDFYEAVTVNAGTDDAVCGLDIGLNATLSTGTGEWSGPAGISFDDISSPTATATATTYGTYTLTWTETNGTCVETAQVVVRFDESPNPNAGTDSEVCGLSQLLAAVPSLGTGNWTQTNGPGTASFNNANSPNATVTVDAYGTYEFTWTETNGTCSNGASIMVDFYEAVTVNAGTDDAVCGLDIGLNATLSTGTGEWSGPAGISFDDISSPTATATATTYGTYTLTWTETNGTCEEADQVVVRFDESPNPNAGIDSEVCGLSQLLAAVPSLGTGTWTQTAGPGTASFNNANSPNATVTVDAYGTYEFNWTETNGTCSNGASVMVDFYEAVTVNAGTDDAVCGLDIGLNATLSTGTGEWSGPAGISFDDISSPTATATATTYGTYTLTWTETNGTCVETDQVVVRFDESPNPNAGIDSEVCGLSQLLAAVPSLGTGTWTQTNGPGTASFNNANSPNATVTVDAYGIYEFTWTETNGTCSNGATISVTFSEQPVANAGTDNVDLCTDTYTMDAAYSVTGSTGSWAQISGPGTTTFSDNTSPTTLITADAWGRYVYEWTEDNNGCTSSARITINYFNQPVADAGSGGDACNLSFLLGANPSSGSGAWTQTAGPGSSSFNNVNSPNATVTVDSYGTYEFTWTETNGVCSNSAPVLVNFFEQPTANAGTDADECALVHTMDAVISISGATGTWTQKSGPGTSIFSDDTSPVSDVTADTYGTYVYIWTEDNNGCTDADEVTIRFNQAATVVSVANEGAVYCEPSSIDLSGVIGGGAFSGTWTLVSGGTGTLSVSSLVGSQVNATYFPAPGEFGPLQFMLTTNDPDGSGPCVEDSQVLNITVTESPKVDAGADFAVCEDAGGAGLSGVISGTATTVQWSGGLGSFDDPASPTATYIFDPSEIGSTVTLTLTAFDPDGAGPCTVVMDEVDVTINPLPVVNFFNLPAVTDEGAAPITLIGNRAGGVFTISPGSGLENPMIVDGQDNVTFDPSNAEVAATNFITYTYTDPNGCSNSITKSVLVNELTSIDFTIQGGITNSDGQLQICNNIGEAILNGIPPVSEGFPVTEFTSPTAGLISNPSSGVYTFNTNVAPGTYEVRYTFTNEFNATSNIIKYVKVVGTPVADFQNLNSCVTESIDFEDLSTLDAGPFPTVINSWFWDFDGGDPGDTLGGPNVANFYDEAGTYDVSLTVTTDFGCTNTIEKQIEIGGVPEAEFTWSNICEADYTIFENETAASTPVTNWNFGDGSTSTDPNPQHIFPAPGSYDVQLVVGSAFGCSDTTIMKVNILPTVNVDVSSDNEYFADFNLNNGNWVPESYQDGGMISWTHGVASGASITSTDPVWFTAGSDGSPGYYSKEQSYLNGPCFNISALERPMVAFDMIYDAQDGFDGVVLQYSINDGQEWVNVGQRNRGIEWFNDQGIIARPGDDPLNFNEGDQGWTGISGDGVSPEWVSSRYSLDTLAEVGQFRLRFAFASDENISADGFALDNFFIGEKKRNVLVEFFADNGFQTSTDYNASLNDLMDDPEVSRFGAIQYHLNQSGLDDFHEENPSDPLARGLFYSVSTAPRFVLDGEVLPTTLADNLSENKIDQQSLIDPLFDIRIDTLTSPQGVINFNIRVESLQDVNKPVVLHAALAEDRTTSDEYRNILKKLFYGGGGLDIPDVWTAGQVETYSVNYMIDVEIIETDKLNLIAFIQDKVDYSIYQAEQAKAPVKDDNGVVTSVGDELEEHVQHISLYPNPVNGRLNFYLPEREYGQYTYTMIDQRGVTMLNGSLDFVNDRFGVDTWDLSNGVYYVIIARDEEPIAQRKIVIMNRVR